MDSEILIGLLDLTLKLIIISLPVVLLVCVSMVLFFLFSIKALKFKKQAPQGILAITAAFMVLFLVANAVAGLPVSTILLKGVPVSEAVLDALSSPALWTMRDVASMLLMLSPVFYILGVKYAYREGVKKTLLACLVSFIPGVLLFIKI